MIDEDLYVFSDMEYDADHSASSDSIENSSSYKVDPLISVKKNTPDETSQKPVKEGASSCLQSILAVLGLGLFFALLLGTIYGTIPWWIPLSLFVVYIIAFIIKEKKTKYK